MFSSTKKQNSLLVEPLFGSPQETSLVIVIVAFISNNDIEF